jgi:hypothetical protein
MTEEDRGPQAAAVAILFLATSWLAVLLRVYVRAIMSNAFGIDDSLAVVTLVSSVQSTHHAVYLSSL